MHYAAFKHSLGTIWMREEDHQITHISFNLPDSLKAGGIEDPEKLRPFFEKLCRYLEGDDAVILPLKLQGTDFQRRVWNELRKIPHGETRSYAEIARAIGSPNASRAVGSACGKNRHGLYIPCHRVLGSSGKLGGFYWGLDKKQDLLAYEQERHKAAS